MTSGHFPRGDKAAPRAVSPSSELGIDSPGPHTAVTCLPWGPPQTRDVGLGTRTQQPPPWPWRGECFHVEFVPGWKSEKHVGMQASARHLG